MPRRILATFGAADVSFAYFEIWVFFSTNEVPPAFEVVGEGAGADEAEAVLFA